MANVEISKRLVLINSASTALTTLLNLSVVVWLQQYLLRRVSAEEYSLVPLLGAVMAFAPLLSMVLTGGLGRYITVAHARGDDDEVTRVCSTMFPLLLLGGVVFLCVGLGCVWQIEHLIVISPEQLWDARLMLSLLVVSGAVQLPAAAFASGFIVRQRLVLQDMISVGCQLFRLLLLFGLLFGVSTRVLWITVATVAGDVLALAIATPVSMRLLPAQRFRRASIKWSLARELTSYGGWSLVNQIAQTAKLAMDPVILNRFSSAAEVATFNVGGLAPRQFPALVGPLCRPFIPVFAMLHATGDFARLSRTYLRTGRYNGWVVLTVAVPAIVFSQEFMSLYLGDRYPGAALVMAMLLGAPILLSWNAMGQAALYAAGEVRALATRQLAVHASNLVLTLAFVAHLGLGAAGSAGATLVAVLFIETALMWPVCLRVTHTPPSAWLREVLLPTALPAIPTIALCVLIKWSVGVSSWVHLIAASALSALSYSAAVGVVGLRDEDKVDLAAVIAKVRRKLGSRSSGEPTLAQAGVGSAADPPSGATEKKEAERGS
ncbi:MAG: lipopolysaccharide biosynthesis protein [Deltaproteobacteria bacterium]|nr:lipopolysaccharide biosynthesis protein [Deltaproteobacteria bacterium]